MPMWVAWFAVVSGRSEAIHKDYNAKLDSEILPGVPKDPELLFPLIKEAEKMRIAMNPKTRVRLKNLPYMWEAQPTVEGGDFNNTCTHCSPLIKNITDGSDVFGLAHVHITKSGGTAIRACNRVAGGCHETVRQIRLDLKNNGTFRTFAVVRHPLSRFISAFYDKWQGGHIPNPHNRLSPEMDDMVTTGEHLLEKFKLGVKHFCWWKPQVNWILDDEFRLDVDYVLRFEHLWDEYSKLKHISTLRGLSKRPVHSSHRLQKLGIKYPNWCSFINTSVSRIVEQLYVHDYEALSDYYQPTVCISDHVQTD